MERAAEGIAAMHTHTFSAHKMGMEKRWGMRREKNQNEMEQMVCTSNYAEKFIERRKTKRNEKNEESEHRRSNDVSTFDEENTISFFRSAALGIIFQSRAFFSLRLRNQPPVAWSRIACAPKSRLSKSIFSVIWSHERKREEKKSIESNFLMHFKFQHAISTARNQFKSTEYHKYNNKRAKGFKGVNHLRDKGIVEHVNWTEKNKHLLMKWYVHSAAGDCVTGS